MAQENGGARLSFTTTLQLSEWRIGDSLAVNGCCLTLTEIRADGLCAAELSPETMSLTNLSALAEGDAVNLEPALRAADPLGGHMVSGHIDGTVTVLSLDDSGGFRDITFTISADLAPYVVTKGSVALNGVSLTVNRVTDSSFSLCLIPHTLQYTNLRHLRVASLVNLETDLVGRYIARQLHFLDAAASAPKGA
ncbi:MAG: riboflavin synthase, partial [Mariprofundales bacterium]|nr:riboflavin synthase [Mariprofundales bacterium]